MTVNVNDYAGDRDGGFMQVRSTTHRRCHENKKDNNDQNLTKKCDGDGERRSNISNEISLKS